MPRGRKRIEKEIYDQSIPEGLKELMKSPPKEADVIVPEPKYIHQKREQTSRTTGIKYIPYRKILNMTLLEWVYNHANYSDAQLAEELAQIMHSAGYDNKLIEWKQVIAKSKHNLRLRGDLPQSPSRNYREDNALHVVLGMPLTEFIRAQPPGTSAYAIMHYIRQRLPMTPEEDSTIFSRVKWYLKKMR